MNGRAFHCGVEPNVGDETTIGHSNKCVCYCSASGDSLLTHHYVHSSISNLASGVPTKPRTVSLGQVANEENC